MHLYVGFILTVNHSNIHCIFVSCSGRQWDQLRPRWCHHQHWPDRRGMVDWVSSRWNPGNVSRQLRWTH